MNLERLYFLCEENDMTQSEIGEIVGTKKFSINKWEKTKTIIPLEKLNILCNYFNVSMDYVLKLSDDKCNSIDKLKLDKILIGNNIKKIREKNNLSQMALARELNTTQSTIWAYETGRTLILTVFAYQICIKYNGSMDLAMW